MKILIIDNYDSFTYNLVHYFEGFDVDVKVLRNDEVEFEDVENADKLVFSPGPGLPAKAGKMPLLIHSFAGKKPMLGVCLGFQAIVEFYHGVIYNQEIVKHGKAENCSVSVDSKLFHDVSPEIKVGLYHSWAAQIDRFPRELIVTAKSENGVIMAFEHKRLPIAGVQFHPESVLTEEGHQIIENFIKHFN
jgi:anthranilate synthase component 2